MRSRDLYRPAALVAERVIRERAISALPVDPIALAEDLGIEVMAKPADAPGVSGMLLRRGSAFGIAYATHTDDIGFQNFSTAHELGHCLLPGHIDAVLVHGDVHESHAGFGSSDRYEMEADHFAATLLMPRALFRRAMRTAGDGLPAIEALAKHCRTSLTAASIRFTRCTHEAVAVIVSTGRQVVYCFVSDALRAVEGLNWIRKGVGLSTTTATFAFNQDPERVQRAERREATSDVRDWFGGDRSLSMTEEVVGLGNYGGTLTVLTALDLDEQIEELEKRETTG